MFEKLERIAGQAATGVSRRHFLRRMSRGAAGAAAGIGTMLAISQSADAGAGPGRNRCCGSRSRCVRPKGCQFVGCLRGSGCVWDCNGEAVLTGCEPHPRGR